MHKTIRLPRNERNATVGVTITYYKIENCNIDNDSLRCAYHETGLPLSFCQTGLKEFIANGQEILDIITDIKTKD